MRDLKGLEALCDALPKLETLSMGSNDFGGAAKEQLKAVCVEAGMLACNDFATCYMCQSLPMGGLRDSGFGKFAGVEAALYRLN